MKICLLLSLLSSLITSNVGATPTFNRPIQKALDTTGTIYEDLSEAKVKAYYSDVKVGDKGETLLTKLDTILKKNIKKCNYGSGTSANSKAWNGYYLTERNWELSPLESSELSGSYKTSGIWINQLYCKSPLYISNSINSGEYKYLDNNGVEVTNTFASSNRQIDREHVFAKSYGFNGGDISYENLTVGCDPHNLHAGEHQGNSAAHNNLPYGVVVNKSATTTTAYTSKMTGESVGYTGLDKNGIKVYEPPEQDKGDIARTCFYMAACYHKYDEHGGTDIFPALTLTNDSNTTKTKDVKQTATSPAEYGQLDALLDWHKADPVSNFEIHRNNLIYNSVGLNRNPFIDYPDWVDACFAPSKSVGATFESLNKFAEKKLVISSSTPLSFRSDQNLDFSSIKFTFTGVDVGTQDIYAKVKGVETKLTSTTKLDEGTYKIYAKFKLDDQSYTSNELDLTIVSSDLKINIPETYKDGNDLKIKIGENIIPQITTTYKDNAATFKMINVDNDEEILDTSTLQNGIYNIRFDVKYGTETYSSGTYKLTVLRKSGNLHDLVLEIDESKVKLKYAQFEKFDSTGIKVTLDDVDITSTATLINKAGEKMTSDYQIVGFDKIEIHAEFELDGIKYTSNSFTIQGELSIVQILIIAGVILATLLLLVIFIGTSKSRKKKRKQAKTFENVVKKASKAINNNKKRR